MVRWLQFGVFSPIMRLHSTSNIFNGKEPWKFGKVTNEIMNFFLRLRHRFDSVSLFHELALPY
jgi:alpha-glucosidase (family GH31 glycosyl hydrolase)